MPSGPKKRKAAKRKAANSTAPSIPLSPLTVPLQVINGLESRNPKQPKYKAPLAGNQTEEKKGFSNPSENYRKMELPRKVESGDGENDDGVLKLEGESKKSCGVVDQIPDHENLRLGADLDGKSHQIQKDEKFVSLENSEEDKKVQESALNSTDLVSEDSKEERAIPVLDDSGSCVAPEVFDQLPKSNEESKSPTSDDFKVVSSAVADLVMQCKERRPAVDTVTKQMENLPLQKITMVNHRNQLMLRLKKQICKQPSTRVLTVLNTCSLLYLSLTAE